MGNRADQYPDMTEAEKIEYLSFLVENGYKNIRLLPGKRWMAIMPFLFTHAIVWGYMGDISCIEDRWCYETYQKAYEALDNWNGEGEPEGWHRHPASGRRRPAGVVEEEYINP